MNMNTVQLLIDQQMGKSIYKRSDIIFERINCIAMLGYKFSCTGVQESEFAQMQGYRHILALVDRYGEISIVNTDKLTYWNQKIHTDAIFDIAWMFNDMKLVTASRAYLVKLIDISNKGIDVVRMFVGHAKPVQAVAVKRDNDSIFATGGRDGDILFWDVRTPAFCGSLFSSDNLISHDTFLARWITGLAFQNEYSLISCTVGDGIIKIWDLRKMYSVAEREPVPRNTIACFMNTDKRGFSNLIVNKTGDRLYASCTDSKIYCYNILTYNPIPIQQYIGDRMNKFYYKSCLSGDETYLLRGSDFQLAYIWDVKYSEPIVGLEVPGTDVTSVAWSQNIDTTLVTCSQDYTRFWKIHPLPDDIYIL